MLSAFYQQNLIFFYSDDFSTFFSKFFYYKLILYMVCITYCIFRTCRKSSEYSLWYCWIGKMTHFLMDSLTEIYSYRIKTVNFYSRLKTLWGSTKYVNSKAFNHKILLFKCTCSKKSELIQKQWNELNHFPLAESS